MAQENEDSQMELAQAFRDLARGEQTAAALERQLGGVERKLDELLAMLDEGPQPGAKTTADSQSPTSYIGSNDEKKREGNGPEDVK